MPSLHNHSSIPKLRSSRFDWAKYDALPSRVKRDLDTLAAACHINASPTDPAVTIFWPNTFARTLEKQRLGTLALYGSAHPGAWPDGPSADELGL